MFAQRLHHAGLGMLLGAGVASAQAVLLEIPNPGFGNSFGDTLAAIGDVDGDGFDDIVVAAPGVNGVSEIYLVSGLDGSQLQSRVLSGSHVGECVVSLPDVDADGLADLVVTAPQATGGGMSNVGGAFVLSGADLSTISSVFGTETGAELGAAVAALDDLDGDGRADYVLGAPEASSVFPQAGRLVVVSSASGDVLQVLEGPGPRRRFGAALAALGDVDGDGSGDLVVGAPGRSDSAGAAAALSGRDLTVLHIWEGRESDRLGRAVTGPGDVNGDGVPDIVLGAPGAFTDGVDHGEVIFHSGATGERLFGVFGEVPGEKFGSVLVAPGDLDQDGHGDVLAVGQSGNRAVSGRDGTVLFRVETGIRAGAPAGDVDRDGHPDIVISKPVWVISGRIPEPVYEHEFGGTSVHGPGDFDGDGFDDYVTGHAESNRAWLVAGKTGRPLRVLEGTVPGSFFGFAVAVVGDVDGDGYDEVAIGARKASGERGEVQLISGHTGKTLLVWEGLALGDGFGAHVAAAGDVDGDGVLDVLVGSPRQDTAGTNAGAVWVFSGSTGHPLDVQYGLAPEDQFGASVSGLGDLNGDGLGDWAAGAPRPPLQGNEDEPGYVRVVSGRGGDALYTVFGDFDRDRFGRALANVGDVNGDGVTDFVVGAPLASAQGASSGMARLHSGADGSALQTLFGLAAKDRLGRMVGALGDLDGDGVPDFAAGALDSEAKGSDTGFVRLYSGFDGAILAMLEADSGGDNLGRSVSGVGDVNGDGWPDFAVGAPEDDTRTHVRGYDLMQFPWTILGGGLAGQRGIPRLRGEGKLEPGRPVRLTMGGAAPVAISALHLGRVAGYVPFHGGYLVPAGGDAIFGLMTDDEGSLAFQLPWPSNLPLGESFYFQVWSEDQGGPEGFAASNAVRATPR